MRGCVDIIELL